MAARDRVRATGVRPTQTLIASMVGISRLEARSLLSDSTSKVPRQSTRIEKILLGWRTDARFIDSRGRPKTIQIRGGKNSFEELARRYGRDITPRAMLEELTRRGLVLVTKSRVVPTKVNSRAAREALSAGADLKFLVSHLSGFEFSRGHRAFSVRRGVVSARDVKGANVVRQLALGRIETLLNSLMEISTEKTAREKQSRKGLQKVLVSAVVAVDSEERKS